MKVRVPAEQTILIHTCGYKADIWKKHLIFGLPERASCARFIEEVNERSADLMRLHARLELDGLYGANGNTPSQWPCMMKRENNHAKEY